MADEVCPLNPMITARLNHAEATMIAMS